MSIIGPRPGDVESKDTYHVQETEKHVMNEKDLQMLKELRLMDDDFFF